VCGGEVNILPVAGRYLPPQTLMDLFDAIEFIDFTEQEEEEEEVNQHMEIARLQSELKHLMESATTASKNVKDEELKRLMDAVTRAWETAEAKLKYLEAISGI
jgi:MoxR-like ATPase